MEGKQILDASLIANEVIDSMVMRKEKGILCKLDVEKAYDKLNWKFLVMVLKEMGFGNKWIGWIQWCISTASFLVIINGSLDGFFKSSRGLRQEDPLIPLFVCYGNDSFLFADRQGYNGRFSLRLQYQG